jgi:Flp pilus assembly protein CpaB
MEFLIMRKFRGAIALCISLCFAFLAAYTVYRHLENSGKPKEKIKPVELPKPKPEKKEPPPPTLTQMVPPGMRAYTIRIDKLEGAPMELTSGDRVDVIAIHPMSLTGYTSDTRMTRILMENVKVLKAGMDNKPSKTRLVTLEATPDQCASLSSALEVSQIRLLIRNPQDSEAIEMKPIGFSMSKGTFDMHEPEDITAAGILKPGMRAVPIRTDWRDGIFGRFKPGDLVDIVLSCPFSKVQKDDGSNKSNKGKKGEECPMYLSHTYRNSKIWRQNVKIIAVSSDYYKFQESIDNTEESVENESDETSETDDDDSGNEEKKSFGGTVIVELPPRDAELLLSVYTIPSKGNLVWLIARHPTDHEKVATDGVRIENIILGKKLYIEIDALRGVERKSKLFYKHR